MPLPTPKLDDRTFADLEVEARRRIAAICPDWTDFNPSDPGITVVELMLWLTELTLYRINKLPEKSFVSFLDMIGVKLEPAEAARTRLVLEPIEAGAAAPRSVPAGTRFQTRVDDGGMVVFESVRGVTIAPVRPIAVMSEKGEELRVFKAVEPALSPCVLTVGAAIPGRDVAPTRERAPQSLFGPGITVPHDLFLGEGPAGPGGGGGEIIERAEPGSVLDVEIALGEPATTPMRLEWERWVGGSGDGWEPWSLEADKTAGLQRDGAVSFRVGEGLFVDPSRAGRVWLRARLVGDPGGLPTIVALSYAFRSPGDGAQPLDRLCRRVMVNQAAIFTELPPPPTREEPRRRGRETSLFWAVPPTQLPGAPNAGLEASAQTALYLASPLMRRTGRRIEIDLGLRNDTEVRDPAAHPAVVRIEFLEEGQHWGLLGLLREGRVERAEHGFVDGTAGLTQDGTIAFDRPDAMAEVPLLEEASYAIRFRLMDGTPDRVVLTRAAVRFREPAGPFGLVLAANYGEQSDLLPSLRAGQAVQPFELRRGDAARPALLLGFDRCVPGVAQRILLDVTSGDADPERMGTVVGLDFPELPAGALPPRPELAWSYFDGAQWAALTLLGDGTKGLSVLGEIELVPPREWTSRRLHGVEAFWLRASFDVLPLGAEPALHLVATNVVEVVNAETRDDSGAPIRWQGDGSAMQTIRFPQPPILSGPRIAVCEIEEANEAQLEAACAEHGPERVSVTTDPDGHRQRGWIEWQEVSSFYRSDASSRHFLADPVAGTVTFGDGRRGMRPPVSPSNIRPLAWRVGGGDRGNVAVGVICEPVGRDLGVLAVRNIMPAAGGRDPETIEDAKLRGAWYLRHRERAVTAGDFERLAMSASRTVARAFCMPEPGRVRLVILPDTAAPRPQPTRQLIEQVMAYLEPRRTLTTRVHVEGPGYLEIAVTLKVVLIPAAIDRFERVRVQIEDALHTLVHPLRGGPDTPASARVRPAPVGRQPTSTRTLDGGWPIGRTLHVSELYYVLEQIDDVDHVEEVRLSRFRSKPQVPVERIRVPASSFPFFRSIDVSQAA